MGEKTSLPSLLNFRDVGSATGNTAALPAGRLYRAYDIDEASKEDRKYLRESLGITSLIKLWGPPEIYVRRKDDPSQYQEQYPDRIRSFQVLDLKVHEISLYSSAYKANLMRSISWKDKARGMGWLLVGQMSNLRAVFQNAFERETGWLKNVADLLTLSKPQIKAVFEALAQEEVCPVLIYGPHASLIFCLLLNLRGVAEDRISQEYLLTEQNSDALLEYDNANRKEFGLAAKTKYDIPRSFVPDVLDYINAEYRGVDVYLSSIGLTHNQLESIKKNLQEPGNSNEKLVDVEEQYAALSYS
ncbi:hypothetical protein KC316_g4141 [Hortaea werneckii]|nr:hypothetical protein KC324_g4252 [Hortaea werneckii]KAI7589071.1 hypothetical protein KC316_g4141 [Hortaea werneckii]